MLPLAILNQKVTIKRRESTGSDSLNNPVYGKPTSGLGWSTIYENVPVRLAFSSKPIKFAPEGERLLPTGIMYYNTEWNILPEDRILFMDYHNNPIEYVVKSVVPGATGNIIDHFEAIVDLP